MVVRLQRLLAIRTENAEEVASSRGGVYPAAEKELDELVAEWATPPRSAQHPPPLDERRVEGRGNEGQCGR